MFVLNVFDVCASRASADILFFFCHCMTKMNVATLEMLALLVIFVGSVPGERFEVFPAYFLVQ